MSSTTNSSSFPITEAQLVALFMEAVAYGIHVVTFIQCLYTWFLRLRDPSKPSRSWPWMSVAVILFAIGTLDVSFNLYHNLYAFVIYKGPDGAESQFNDLSNWVNVMRSVWARLSATISDAALISRLWIVYTSMEVHLFVVAVPILLWLGATACAVMDIELLSTLHLSSSIPGEQRLRPYLVGYYVMTLVLNVLATGLIVYRIWGVHHGTTGFYRSNSLGTDRVTKTIRIFVESALLYTVSVTVSVIVELAKSNAYYGTSDLSVELAGITFDLIIIRIWRGVTAEQSPAFARSWDREVDARRDAAREVTSIDRSRAVSPIVVRLETICVDNGKDGR
ncbi:hypothetical protein EVJ58_g3676 [Rhodofomes roseus]|uniref:Uncharacterized protein n=1 Tax=Rhodofomes roseus TaxID=34475 RepID=A0A4Y9YML2_9APHY|nr:hypothetical protein EVJ58_g3676 [Rhodofomes roseus]